MLQKHLAIGLLPPFRLTPICAYRNLEGARGVFHTSSVQIVGVTLWAGRKVDLETT